MPPEAAVDDQIDDEPIEGDGEGDGEAPKESSEEAVRVAKLMGWKPKDQWKGDVSNWRPAEDFLAEVPDVLRNTRKKAERLEGQQARIIAQLSKVQSGQNKQANADARKAAKEAFEAGDFDAAEKILTSTRGPAADPEEPPALTAFKERNEWFGVDDEATAYASALDNQYAKAAGGVADPDAHMRKVEAGVKKRFPELFGEKAKDDDAQGERRRAPLLSRGNGRSERARSEGMTVADMTPQQRSAAKQMGVSDKDWVKSYNQWKGA